MLHKNALWSLVFLCRRRSGRLSSFAHVPGSGGSLKCHNAMLFLNFNELEHVQNHDVLSVHLL